MSKAITFHNPINSVSDIIERLSSFSPLTAIGTKNFKKVIDLYVDGANIVEVLNNPVEMAGVAPQQAHIFTKFLEANPLPKKLRRSKLERSIASQATLQTIEEDASGKLVSARDYSDFGQVGEDEVSGYIELSSSYAAEHLAPLFSSSKMNITTKKNIEGRVMERTIAAYMMPHVFFVDMFGEEDGDLAKKQRMVKEGFYYIDHEGEERRAMYVKRSPSQERVVQGIFVAEHIIHPIDALHAVGMNPFSFAKIDSVNEDGQTVYKLDYAKAMKRFGLTLSNSSNISLIRFGKTVTIDKKTGDVIISGGNFTARIVEDTFSVANTGLFKAFGRDTKKGRIFDAALHSVKQIAGDGQVYINERFAKVIAKQSGRPYASGVFRLNIGASKGNAVFTPGLNKYFPEDVVIPMSSFKGSLDTLEDSIQDMDIQFRIAGFGSPMKHKKQFVKLPYQFVHGMKISAETMIKLVQPHLDRVKDMLDDPELMKQYLGLEKLLDMDELDVEEQQEQLQTSLVSLLTTFLHYSEKSYVDIYLKEKALILLQEMLEDWKSGAIPVEANYRHIIMDPYAILAAYKSRGTNHEIRKDGELYVNPSMGLKADTAFMIDKDSETIFIGEIAVARNPAMTKGQSRVLNCVAPNNYVMASAKGAFDGIIIMSCHDFNTIAQGGADTDGDTSMCMTQKELVDAVRFASKTAPAFLDIYFYEDEEGQLVFDGGCPYPGEADMSKYTFHFTKEQYTREKELEMYHASLDYVAETLKPNRIGELTDLATKLADAVRSMGYKMMALLQAGKQEEAGRVNARIKELEEMIDLLAWVQSWEIDRAKHGGAYEVALAEQLAFIENPPAEVAYYDVKSESVRWFTPDWMGHRKGKEINGYSVRKTDSVLSRVHHHIVKWEQDVLVGAVKEMRLDNKDNNLTSMLSAAIQLPENKAEYMVLLTNVRNIKTNYNTILSDAYKKAESARKEMAFITFKDAASKEQKENAIKRELDDTINYAVELSQAEFFELQKVFTPEQIGLMAYRETYAVSESKRGATADTPARGLSFPWSAAKFQLLEAVRVAENNTNMLLVKPEIKHFDDLSVNKVNIGNFTPGYDMQTIANMIMNWDSSVGVGVLADAQGNYQHHVFVEKQRVASIYPEYITQFTGGTFFKAEVKDLVLNGKSISFKLVSVKKM